MMFNRRDFLVSSGSVLLATGCKPVSEIVLPKVKLAPINGLRSWNGFDLPEVDTHKITDYEFTLINVWATWCSYCRSEHPFLMKLARDNRFKLIGLVNRDTPEKVIEYLKAEGNPYKALSIDIERKLIKPLRTSGVPNTFLINRSLKVIANVSGVISEQSIQNVFEPAIQKDRREQAQKI